MSHNAKDCQACQDVLNALKAPFAETAVQWRSQNGVEVPYIDARTARDRLDEVFGPFGWQFHVAVIAGRRALPQGRTEMAEERKNPGQHVGGVVGVLQVRDPETGQWIQRADGADQSEVESFKGGISDAFKRACVAFGIGAYLYEGADAVRKLYRDQKKAPATNGYFKETANGRVPIGKWEHKVREQFAPSTVPVSDAVKAGTPTAFQTLRAGILAAGDIDAVAWKTWVDAIKAEFKAGGLKEAERLALMFLADIGHCADPQLMLATIQRIMTDGVAGRFLPEVRDRLLVVAQAKAKKLGVPVEVGV